MTERQKFDSGLRGVPSTPTLIVDEPTLQQQHVRNPNFARRMQAVLTTGSSSF